ncbi:PucR family transcriptional regulator [Phytoactinopolyspora alkaliphila]|uniref:PucR family transcriptional regulator n=1 Tax=Phytoactinopolyspora alkaliphila TaxID=1783498 RepID=A0A6N9YG99_9ACTN|nr:PucR family transcriptional regulator [Phytoactinopolyspora alkaliphila]NED93960.1 PucR family transcriptional regulator [Phytoactinopolyspora alkaliphila]
MEILANDEAQTSPELPGRPGEPRPEHAMPGLTVGEAMEMTTLAGARLLAGAGGLDRIVRRANIMEVPDILPWVKPHELLLTTGYPLRNTPQGLPGLVTDLNARGLAAMGVKLHRYLDSLPEQMIAEADRLDLPLLLLPDAIGFDDILNQVLTGVLHIQASELERSWEIHHALLSVVLEGGGLNELAVKTSAVLGAPVFVTTADGRVLAEGGRADELDAWRTSACFDETGRFRTEYEPGGAHTHPDVPGSHAMVPIVAGRVDHGRIVAFSADRKVGDGDVNVLERAATVAALAVNKQLAVTAVEGKYRGDFLRDVLAGRAGDRDRIVAHCQTLGWDIDRPLVVVVAELDPGHGAAPASGLELRPVQERFTVAWQSVVARRDSRTPVVGFAQEVVALLPVPPSGDVDGLVRDVVRQVSGDGGGGRRAFSTGVSRAVDGPDRLPGAYEQARRAVQVGRQINGTGGVAHFDALRSFRLISLVGDHVELRGFVDETLHELANDGDAEMADLRHTLKVLLDANLNVAEAARTLHFHYNTLRYRISKLERILGPFTTDPELRLDLALALKVLQMRGLR